MAGRPSRQAIYDRLDAAFAELRDRMGGLPNPSRPRASGRGIWYEEAHHSTAIEGNTLVLKQVERLLAEGVPSATRSSRSTWRSRATPTPRSGSTARRSSRETGRDGELLTLTEVRQVHAMAIGPGLGRRSAPATRPTASARELSRARHPALPRRDDASALDARCRRAMRDWLDERATARAASATIPEALARAHARLRAHPPVPRRQRPHRAAPAEPRPRAARLRPRDHLQARSDQVPRRAAAADTGDPGPLGEMLARSVLDNLYRFIVPAVAGPNRLVPLGRPQHRHAHRGSAARRREPQPPPGPEGTGRPVAKHPSLGRRLRRFTAQARTVTPTRRVRRSRNGT